MNKVKTVFAWLILLAIVPCHGISQTRQSSAQAGLARKIERYLQNLETVGFSGTVLVEINGLKVISKGYGYRDLGQKLRNTPETIFDIGSLAKQFTAAAILKLEMQGKLSTADKITKYFDNVPADKRDITIHQLLRHSSGLPGGVGGDYEPITEADFVDKVMKASLRFPSGTRFSYSNIGYSLLAMIVEKASGASYEVYLSENLWKPAGMKATGYSLPRFSKDSIAVGYNNKEVWGRPTEKAWDKDAPYWHLKGNGGILSTVEDLYKWHVGLRSATILSPTAKKKYYHPELRPDEDPNPYYGYGWDMFRTKRNTMVARHNGTNRIFFADFHRYLDEGVTIISLSNRADQSFTSINREIGRMIFNPGYQPPIPVEDNDANRAFTSDIMQLTIEKGFDAGWNAYRSRKKNVDLLEREVNARGYELMEENKLAKSIDVFRLNTSAFPRSANAFDSLGEAYLESGNNPLALVNYRKSFELDPENLNAEEVIKRLSGK